MYATQSVPFDGCQFTIPTSDVNGPHFDYIFTSFIDKDERICWIFVFDAVLSLKLNLLIKSLNYTNY